MGLNLHFLQPNHLFPALSCKVNVSLVILHAIDTSAHFFLLSQHRKECQMRGSLYPLLACGIS